MRRQGAVVLKILFHFDAVFGQRAGCLGDLAAEYIITVLRNGDGGNDADDGHDDQEFNQSKTACGFHDNSLLWEGD